VRPESHICTPKSVRKCEKMNPHILKWTFILGVGVLMEFQIFKELQRYYPSTYHLLGKMSMVALQHSESLDSDSCLI
jgi:hypothetical protein